MNLDELMAVWRTQDAAPLHDVNKTLLHQALRQDEARLQKWRRRERWIIYACGAGVVAGMALLLALMIYRDRATGWDYALLIVGATAALLTVRTMHVNYLAQSWMEKNLGESLRDQLNRRIAQLDEHATIAARRSSVLAIVLMAGICPTAIILLVWRMIERSISDDWFMLGTMILVCAWSVRSSVREQRRSVEQDILPRKRRLEALLKELGGQ